MRLLDQPDDLQLFGSRISHSSSAPSAIMLFLSRRNSRACSATTSFSAWASRRRSLTSPLAPGDALTSAQLRDPVLAAKPIQHDADFLLARILLARRPANVSHDPLGRQFGASGFLAHLHSSMVNEPEILPSSNP